MFVITKKAFVCCWTGEKVKDEISVGRSTHHATCTLFPCILIVYIAAWFSHGISVAVTWVSHGISVAVTWVSHGISVAVTWKPRASVKVSVIMCIGLKTQTYSKSLDASVQRWPTSTLVAWCSRCYMLPDWSTLYACVERIGICRNYWRILENRTYLCAETSNQRTADFKIRSNT